MNNIPQPPLSYTEEMVISVVGPTATGKTAYALQLAGELINRHQVPVVALISADSRQIYQGLEIVSGADIPADYVLQPYAADWQLSPTHFFAKKQGTAQIELHGVSCVSPASSWSLAHFQRFAHRVIAETWKQGGVPIIVGGTGLYHARLFSAELQDISGPNQDLRDALHNASLPDLQKLVQAKSQARFNQMTLSDQHNKRRLIRVLEQLEDTDNALADSNQQYQLVQPKQHQVFNLTDSIEVIEQRIAQRVAARLAAGAIQEVEQLSNQFAAEADLSIFSATGVKEIRAYLSDKISRTQLEELWFRRERQYAKRQITWWKKHNQGI